MTTTAASTPTRARWRVLLLAALAAVVALLLPAAPASAASHPAAENSVGVFHAKLILPVGVHHSITAGGRRVRGPSQLQVVSVHCVAAEDAANGAGHVFWSGEGTEAAATSFAAENGGTTLGMTAEGQAVARATENLPWSEARPLWVKASQQFAESAQGTVHVFQSAAGVSVGSIWAQTEWGALLDNPAVEQIVFHIVGAG